MTFFFIINIYCPKLYSASLCQQNRIQSSLLLTVAPFSLPRCRVHSDVILPGTQGPFRVLGIVKPRPTSSSRTTEFPPFKCRH